MDTQTWIQREQWFMRGSGIVLLLLAGLGMVFGIFSNPDNEAVLSAMNIIIALGMAAAGAWTLWFSSSAERITKMLENIHEQGAGTTRALAVVQTIVGILFLLEGVSRAGIVMLLLGIAILISAAFFFWRGQAIAKVS